MTTGLLLAEQVALTPARSTSTINSTSTTPGRYANPTSATLSRIAATRDQSAQSKQARTTPVNLNQQAKKTSASLHNLSNLSTNDLFTMTNNSNSNTNGGSSTGRYRRDSYASTVSSVGVGNLSINSTPSVEYKENKAYELRKKSALMNKIVGKGAVASQGFGDPIYTRSHPVSTELANEQQHSISYLLLNQQQMYHPQTTQSPGSMFLNNLEHDRSNNLGSQASNNSTTSSAARKRLFAKKNERNTFDPNASIQSNASSASSSTTSGNTQPHAASTLTRNSNPIATMKEVISPRRVDTKSSMLPKSRSKSTNFGKAEVNGGSQQTNSNSTRDLIELINRCEAPQGDLDSYQLMLNECERFVQSASNKTLVSGETTLLSTTSSSSSSKPVVVSGVKLDVDTFVNGLTGTEVYSTSSLSSPFSLSPSGASNSPNSMIGSSLSNQSHSPVNVLHADSEKRKAVLVINTDNKNQSSESSSRRARSVPYDLSRDELDQ